MNERTILYVEDDPDDAMIIQDIFHGLENVPTLHVCEEGNAALDFLKHNDTVCFVLIDINMPGMDGKTLVKLIKEEASLKNMPLAFLSTTVNKFDEDFALNFGMLFFE